MVLGVNKRLQKYKLFLNWRKKSESYVGDQRERNGSDRRVEGAGGGQYSFTQTSISNAVGQGKGRLRLITRREEAAARHGRAGWVGARGFAGGRERGRGHRQRDANRLARASTAVATAAANGFTPAILSGGLRL